MPLVWRCQTVIKEVEVIKEVPGLPQPCPSRCSSARSLCIVVVRPSLLDGHVAILTHLPRVRHSCGGEDGREGSDQGSAGIRSRVTGAA